MDLQAKTRFELPCHTKPEADNKSRSNVGENCHGDVDNSKGKHVIEVGMRRNSVEAKKNSKKSAVHGLHHTRKSLLVVNWAIGSKVAGSYVITRLLLASAPLSDILSNANV